MEFTPVQSPDVPINNPLKIDDPKQDHQPTTFDWKKITTNPRILLLSILVVFIFVLLVAAVIKITFQRPTTNVAIPTPAIAKPTSPVQIQELIPTGLKINFDQIDQILERVNPLPPPQIDEKISL